MKKTVFILLVLFASIVGVQGQVLDASNPQVAAALADANIESSPLSNFFQKRTPMMDKLFQQVQNENDYEVHYVGAEVGSAYETENYAKGKIYYEDELLGNFYYRYNGFTDEVELKKTLLEEEDEKALIQDPKVKLVSANGTEVIYDKYITKKKKFIDGHLTQLVAGDQYSLYRRLHVKFSEAKPAENSMVNPKPSKFTQYQTYFLKTKESNAITEIPLKKTKLLKLIAPETSKKLDSYVKEQNLDITKEEDLKRLFTFANTLP